MKETVEVTDLFRGAFLLCMGADLAEVRVRCGARPIATFRITGKDIERLDDDYRAGRARVNPVRLRESLNHLRDVMFETLQDSEGRKKNDDRSRIYRPGQAY